MLSIARLTPLVVVLGVVGLLGCSKTPLEVATIQLGRSLNADNTVGHFTTTFKSSDKIYVSVITKDMGSGTITVRWSYNGRPAGERSKPVSYTIGAATEFHMESAAGFPVGPYTAEILVDGKQVATRSFTVVP